MSREDLRAAADKEVDRWEQKLADELIRLFDRQEAVVLARLQGTKAKKHTRHAYGKWKGDRPLEVKGIIDPVRWLMDAAGSTRPLVSRLFESVYARVAKQLDPEAKSEPADDRLAKAIDKRVELIQQGVKTAQDQVEQFIVDAEDGGKDLPTIVAGVQNLYATRKAGWAARIATVSAVGSINQAATFAASDNGSSAKQWLSRKDDRVRDTHVKADGQVRLLDERFRLGIPKQKSLLMFPGDPAPSVPLDEIMNCRCTLLFSPPRKKQAKADEPLEAKVGETPTPGPAAQREPMVERPTGLPKQQKCKYCDEQATKRVMHAEGRAYVPVCDDHVGKATAAVGGPNEVDDVVQIKGRARARVRTAGGAQQYGQAIGTVIRRDIIGNIGGSDVEIAGRDKAVRAMIKKQNPGLDQTDTQVAALRDSRDRVGAYVVWNKKTGAVVEVSVHPKLRGQKIGDQMVALVAAHDPKVTVAPRAAAPASAARPPRAPRPPRATGAVGDLGVIDDLSGGQAAGTTGDYDADAARIDSLQKKYARAGQDTQALFSRGANTDPNASTAGGRWTREREAEHQAIVDSFINKPGVKADRKLLVLGGMPGAGKTTTLHSKAAQDALGVELSEYVTVNSDEVKAEMIARGLVPDYPGLAPEESMALIQAESYEIAQVVMRQAATKGLNFAYDATLRTSNQLGAPEAAIKRHAPPGYTTTMVLIDVPMATAKQRARDRYLAGDRYVPLGFIDGMKAHSSKFDNSPEENFEGFKRQVDSWAVFDNSGAAPVLVDQGQGGKAKAKAPAPAPAAATPPAPAPRGMAAYKLKPGETLAPTDAELGGANPGAGIFSTLVRTYQPIVGGQPSMQTVEVYERQDGAIAEFTTRRADPDAADANGLDDADDLDDDAYDETIQVTPWVFPAGKAPKPAPAAPPVAASSSTSNGTTPSVAASPPAPSAAVPQVPANLPTPDPGTRVFVHPQGKHIYLNPDGSMTVYKPDGKRGTSSATPAKLLAGYGGWDELGANAGPPLAATPIAAPSSSSSAPAAAAIVAAPSAPLEVSAGTPAPAGAMPVVPMDFNEAELKDVPRYIADDDYVFQQKVDGIRGVLVIEPGKTPWFASKKGDRLQSSTAAKVTTPMLAKLPATPAGSPAYRVEGEILDGKFHVFDMIVAGDEKAPYEERKLMADAWVDAVSGGLPQAVKLPTAATADEKQALWDAVLAGGAEGVMMKRKDAGYNGGRRVNHTLKAKITATADVVILERNRGGKDNAVFGMNVGGKVVEIGTVSTGGKDKALGKIQPGEVVEVEYLWATPGAIALTQPRIVRKRPDKTPADATDTGQLRFVDKSVLDLTAANRLMMTPTAEAPAAGRRRGEERLLSSYTDDELAAEERDLSSMFADATTPEQRLIHARQRELTAEWTRRREEAFAAPIADPALDVELDDEVVDADGQRGYVVGLDGDTATLRMRGVDREVLVSSLTIKKKSKLPAARAGGFRPDPLSPVSGDMMVWEKTLRANVRERLTTRNGHQVLVEGDYTADQVDAILERLDVVFKAAPLKRPVTVRLPKPGSDKVFRRSPSAAAYATDGNDTITVNPAAITGQLFDVASQNTGEATLMESYRTDPLLHTLAHEVGHVVDSQHSHMRDSENAGRARTENGFWRKCKHDHAQYGASSAAEGYAEAFALWLLQGKLTGTDPDKETTQVVLAQQYADRYGWSA